MSRRSSRRAPKKAALTLSAGTSTGLSSLIDGNETTIASMLSVSISKNDTSSSATKSKLLEALTNCMAMNNLSAEALLARFFHVDLLRKYCEDRLDVSSKGNEATLAARIVRAWSKPNFEPIPLKKDGAAATKKASSKKQSDGKKKGGSLKGDLDSKKRSGETKVDNNPKDGDEKEESSSAKKRKTETRPSYTVTAPPGQLGFTIKQYSEDFIVVEVTPSCAIQPEGKLRIGDVILAIDGSKITSENNDILKVVSDKSREITIAERVRSMKAAEHPKGSLLYMKEKGMPMFRIMDYSSVAEKYGEEFLEELSPPNRGKSGGQLLAGALSSLSAGRK